MIIVFLLSIHALLILVYADLIERRLSRLPRSYLIFAGLFPFIGEICLIICEFGQIATAPLYTSPFLSSKKAYRTADGWDLPSDWNEILISDEEQARSLILQIINHTPENHVDVLKCALESKSSEVCHLAAAQLMKLHQLHESRIEEARNDYHQLPGSMDRMLNLIRSIESYRRSGLLEGTALEQIWEEEYGLVGQYLEVMPRSTAALAEATDLAIEMHNPQAAVEYAFALIKNADAAENEWLLAKDAVYRYGDPNEKMLFEELSVYHQSTMNRGSGKPGVMEDRV